MNNKINYARNNNPSKTAHLDFIVAQLAVGYFMSNKTTENFKHAKTELINAYNLLPTSQRADIKSLYEQLRNAHAQWDKRLENPIFTLNAKNIPVSTLSDAKKTMAFLMNGFSKVNNAPAQRDKRQGKTMLTLNTKNTPKSASKDEEKAMKFLFSKASNADAASAQILFSKEIILEAALLHFENTNQWPNKNSGNIKNFPDLEGKTWNEAEIFLTKQNKNQISKNLLTSLLKPYKQVSRSASMYLTKRGLPPTSDSGIIEFLPLTRQNWADISKSMDKGTNGFLSSISLERLTDICETVYLRKNPDFDTNLTHYKRLGLS